jgi:hypothetical protein
MDKLEQTIIIINAMLDSNNLNGQVETEQALFLSDDLEQLRLAQAIIKRYHVTD